MVLKDVKQHIDFKKSNVLMGGRKKAFISRELDPTFFSSTGISTSVGKAFIITIGSC